MATLRRLPARARVVPMGRAYTVSVEFHAKLGWAARVQTWVVHHYGKHTAYGERTRWKLDSDRYVRELTASGDLGDVARRVSKEVALALAEQRLSSMLARYKPEQVRGGNEVPEFPK